MDSKHEQLQDMQQKYVAGLEEKLSGLRTLYSQIDRAEPSPDALRSLLHRLHTLSGSAGTFGLHALSAAASRLEHQLNAVVDSAAPPEDALWSQIGRELARLEELIMSPDALVTAHNSEPEHPVGKAKTSTIDLIEDNEEEAEYLANKLQQAGFVVRVFPTGERYKRAWANPDFIQPDAILMDMVLPAGRLAGADVVNAIKPTGSSVPVVFVSQRDDLDARLAAFAAGAVRYYAKPVNVDQLIAVLDGITGRQPAEPYRVLLVDDEPELLMAQAEMLRMAGMSVMPLTDPTKALEALHVFQPDVLVLDVYMPEVSGPELAAIIRDSDDYLNLPIVFLSGEKDLSQQLFALSLGGDDFMVKPLRQDHLVSAVSARARRARQNNLTIKRLRHAEQDAQRLRRALDPHAVLIEMDETGVVTEVNPGFETLTGQSAGQALGRKLLALPTLGQQGAQWAAIKAEVDNAGLWRASFEFRHISGISTKLSITITAYNGHRVSGRPGYLLVGTTLGAHES